MLIVLTTTSTADEATALAEKIVEARLGACVQILHEVRSIYFWNGSLRNEPECLLLVKTAKDKYDELAAFIVRNHSYETPEVVAVEAARASEAYLNWLHANLT